jgi:trk system potassium uptake protein
MQYRSIIKILGIVLMLFSFCMLPPILVDLIYNESGASPFIKSFLVTAGMGFLLWQLCRSSKEELRGKEGFLIVVLTWTVLSVFGAFPFMLEPILHANLTDAIFESVSGLTTTGASIITHLSTLPHALLFYRQETQFFGGMGIVVLTVAVLPMLGVGGMQLFRAETPGPMKDAKLTPRITETAKALWYIYAGITVLGAFAFIAGGMSPFDAIGESFAAVSTGGFSLHDESFVYYHSSISELICVVLMWLGGTNFSLFFLVLKQKRFGYFWIDTEFKLFIGGHILIAVLIAIWLMHYHTYQSFHIAFIESLFNVVSLGSTTGFVSADFSSWPTFTPYLIMITALIGGCSGSTAGGIKIMRTLLLKKQISLEVQRLLHPKSVTAIRFGKQSLPIHTLESMWAFLAVFFIIYVLMILLLLADGLDLTSSFGAVTAAISNAGAGIGKVSVNFGGLSFFTKWVLIGGMLLGRLEVFTILVLFSRSFWQD